MALYDEVYGLNYNSATTEMNLLFEGIKQQEGIGFADESELKEWAHLHQLDKVLFNSMSHQFLCISHKGEIMTPQIFMEYYGSVLFTEETIGKKHVKLTWRPQGFEYFSKAYIPSEMGDGLHRPLYYRDYTVPTGYYNAARDAFNVAKPFPVFARETGRDTSHIYTYIEHIGGVCAPWLLAWLRAKLLYPTVKTQVVPIIVSRAQGSGKTTFAEVICKGLFGGDNVLVTDQYDSQSRFNADYADALIICQEEKELEDKRNPAGALKSRATATTIRKEKKGIDPSYQESYTDFIMTTNKDVPIKFDGREDQRRFMIMEADEHFTRKESELADEVFTKLYGFNGNYVPSGTPFVNDRDLIAQFKHELFTRKDIAEVPLRNFPKTPAYKRCFTLPRTTEATEIESIVRALAPFIVETLKQEKLVTELNGVRMQDIIQFTAAVQYMPAFRGIGKFVALCRPLVFYEGNSNKPFAHSTVERALFDCDDWLRREFGLTVLPDMEALPGGFTGIGGRHRSAPAAKLCLLEDMNNVPIKSMRIAATRKPNNGSRKGERFRVNAKFKPDPNGCFETVNEMKAGVTSLKYKTRDVAYLDTFLLEGDECTASQKAVEEQRARELIEQEGDGASIEASELYKERLETALAVGRELFDAGKVCRIVYSGAKSYHFLVRVRNSPSTFEEYRWLHAWLCQNIDSRIKFDASTSDPARLTRSPLKLPRASTAYGLLVEGTQELICENWGNIFETDWRPLYEQWTSRPLKKYESKGRALLPTSKEYQEAVEALMEPPRFWTDHKFDGNRQHLFFPAYRLLRGLGFSHEELWDSGKLMQGIEQYKHPDEITYWKTRATCSLIKKIDDDIDAYEQSIKGTMEVFNG